MVTAQVPLLSPSCCFCADREKACGFEKAASHFLPNAWDVRNGQKGFLPIVTYFLLLVTVGSFTELRATVREQNMASPAATLNRTDSS